jgi:anthranilate phosphoribosyltransferase
MAETLRETGIVFMFAPLMHPAMKHVGPVRRELGIPTVMNIVGPLANPAGAGRQVVGVADPERMPILAGALASLGSRRAMVVHGAPGLDEISPLGRTVVLEVEDGSVREWLIDPEAFGFHAITERELQGGDPAANAGIVIATLEGKGTPGARAAVVLNAAAAIYLAGTVGDFAAAVRIAAAALDDGAGLAALERLITANRKTS